MIGCTLPHSCHHLIIALVCVFLPNSARASICRLIPMFPVSSAAVKAAIERLISREYLERDATTATLFRYLA